MTGRDPLTGLTLVTDRAGRDRLDVLAAICDVQADGHLSADVTAVRVRAAGLTEPAFLAGLAGLLADGLAEAEVSGTLWRCWATRAGWTVADTAGDWLAPAGHRALAHKVPGPAAEVYAYRAACTCGWLGYSYEVWARGAAGGRTAALLDARRHAERAEGEQ